MVCEYKIQKYYCISGAILNGVQGDGRANCRTGAFVIVKRNSLCLWMWNMNSGEDEMRLGIMQPYFFPYIGYWQLLNAVDEYVIFDDVNYIKRRGWINRNYILINGRLQRINLHIRKASQNKLIKDTKLAQTDENNKVLLETIKMGYHKAPYFDEVYDLLKDIFSYSTDCLSEFLKNELVFVCSYLGIETQIFLSSEIKKKDGLRGEDKILDICKSRSATQYFNAIGGRDLYHQERFKAEDIELYFLHTKPIKYKQFTKDFVPDLSIIDVMMFNSVDEVRLFLGQYDLVK